MAAPVATPSYLSGSLGKIEGQPASFEAPSLFPTLLNITLSLTFVVTLIYVINWLLRRWRSGKGENATGGQGVVQVIEKTWLDNKRGLAVVELGGEIYFLGMGEDVSLIGHISDPARVTKIKDDAPVRGGLLSFQEQFERVGLALRRDQWKRSKQDMKANAADLDQAMQRLKPQKKKEAE